VMLLIWVVLLVAGGFYCYSLVFRMRILSKYAEIEDAPAVIQEYFPSLYMSMMTSAQVLLGSVKWHDKVTQPLFDSGETTVEAMMWFGFTLVIQLFMANVVLGLFVERIFHVAHDSDTDTQLERLVTQQVDMKRMVDSMEEVAGDVGHDGRLIRAQLRTILEAGNDEGWLELSEGEVDEVMHSLPAEHAFAPGGVRA